MSKAKKKKASTTAMAPVLKWAATKYGIATIVFVVWTGCLDKHDFLTNYKLKSTINDLERQVDRNQELVEIARQEKIDIEQNIEKYAREKYYMHRPEEDVLIIDTKTENKTQ